MKGPVLGSKSPLDLVGKRRSPATVPYSALQKYPRRPLMRSKLAKACSPGIVDEAIPPALNAELHPGLPGLGSDQDRHAGQGDENPDSHPAPPCSRCFKSSCRGNSLVLRWEKIVEARSKSPSRPTTNKSMLLHCTRHRYGRSGHEKQRAGAIPHTGEPASCKLKQSQRNMPRCKRLSFLSGRLGMQDEEKTLIRCWL